MKKNSEQMVELVDNLDNILFELSGELSENTKIKFENYIIPNFIYSVKW